MSGKLLLSIAIPTYNRANCLENLLKEITTQIKEIRGLVEICLSNNASTDNTREVVMSFKNKYPSLIKYNENEKNLGYDKNLIKVVEMSAGKFVWLLGDDDMVVKGGIKKVASFINNHCDRKTALIILGHQSHFFDNGVQKKIVYFTTKKQNKPLVYEINIKDIIGLRLINSFISILLFNNNFLKKILEEEKTTIEKAVGNHYIHMFLYNLMFLKYPKLKTLKFNEIIIDTGLSRYKFYIEDEFKLYYSGRIKLSDLLLSSEYISDYYKKIIVKQKRELKIGAIRNMGAMKAFGQFNYSSFFGCFKVFFQQATLKQALLFSIFFMTFSITPSILLKALYKIFVRIKYKKNWQKAWIPIVTTYTRKSKGNRRLIS